MPAHAHSRVCMVSIIGLTTELPCGPGPEGPRSTIAVEVRHH